MGSLVVTRRQRVDIAADLWERGYPVFNAPGISQPARTGGLPVAVEAVKHLFDPDAWTVPPAVVSTVVRPDELVAVKRTSHLPVVQLESSPVPLARAYDYLLGISLGQLSSDALERSAAEAEMLRQRLEAVSTAHPIDQWVAELALLERGLLQIDGNALGFVGGNLNHA